MARHPERRIRRTSLTSKAQSLGCLALVAALLARAYSGAVVDTAAPKRWTVGNHVPSGSHGSTGTHGATGSHVVGSSGGSPFDGLVVRSRDALPRPFDSMPRPTSTPARSTLAAACRAGVTLVDIDCGRDDDETPAVQNDSDPGLAIAGRVLSADGAGIAGVTLTATPIVASDSDSLRYSTGPARYRTVSDANGAYFFAGLPEGHYTVRSNRHDNYPSVRISVSAGIEQANIVLSSE
jgi:hypothetical protein